MAKRESTVDGIPAIVRKLTSYLMDDNAKVEGIFRHSGNDTLIETMKKQIDSGDPEFLPPGTVFLLRKYLRLFQERM